MHKIRFPLALRPIPREEGEVRGGKGRERPKERGQPPLFPNILA